MSMSCAVFNWVSRLGAVDPLFSNENPEIDVERIQGKDLESEDVELARVWHSGQDLSIQSLDLVPTLQVPALHGSRADKYEGLTPLSSQFLTLLLLTPCR